MCIEYTSLNFGYKNSIIRQFHSLSIDTFAASYTMLTSLPGIRTMSHPEEASSHKKVIKLSMYVQ